MTNAEPFTFVVRYARARIYRLDGIADIVRADEKMFSGRANHIARVSGGQVAFSFGQIVSVR